MPKEKWLIDPGELDEFQRKILDLDINDSFVINGCAGSGKTILALYRAREIDLRAKIAGEYPSFTFVVLTKTLKDFIRTGIVELGIDIHQVIHYEKWDADTVDYIIVDECQDFTNEQIQIMMDAKNKSIMLYGDSEQLIYAAGLPTSSMSTEYGIKEKKLFKNYRLPRTIADFVSHLVNDKAYMERCVKPGTVKPKIKKWPSWEAELDYIIAEIKTRNYTDTAILLPFNNKMVAKISNQGFRNVESVKEYFDSKGFLHEAKLSDEGFGSYDLDFDSEIPKVMTFHSAKGLQFETIFVPFCDYPQHDGWLVRNYKKPLYVALTRTYKNLYITYTGSLTRFFEDIPVSKYD